MSRLLLLEDEIEIGENLSEILRREGYDVEWAKTGDDAIELAIHQHFDLMILDMMLKRGTISNGMEVARVVRLQKNIPFLLLTSRSDPFDIMLALDSGAEDYITKPYDLSVLLARVRVVLRRDQQSVSKKQYLKHGGIVIDLASQEVIIDEKPVQLSNQLFKILQYMVQNKKKVISKELLYKDIWGYDSVSPNDPNTLEVNIKRLRQHIGAKRIKTVRGKGYMLE